MNEHISEHQLLNRAAIPSKKRMIQWLIDAMNQVYDKMLERLSNEGPQETIQ